MIELISLVFCSKESQPEYGKVELSDGTSAGLARENNNGVETPSKL